MVDIYALFQQWSLIRFFNRYWLKSNFMSFWIKKNQQPCAVIHNIYSSMKSAIRDRSYFTCCTMFQTMSESQPTHQIIPPILLSRTPAAYGRQRRIGTASSSISPCWYSNFLGVRSFLSYNYLFVMYLSATGRPWSGCRTVLLNYEDIKYQNYQVRELQIPYTTLTSQWIVDRPGYIRLCCM